MYLFVFESIGTSELILIGIVALMFLGPRKLPEMARKIGKIMAEFRGTAREFKQTWEREASFEDEAKALDLKAIEAEAQGPKLRDEPSTPSVRAISAEEFKNIAGGSADSPKAVFPVSTALVSEDDDVNDKKNWL